MRKPLLLALLAFAPTVLADEGMWQPHQLPQIEDKLERLGLSIDPDNLSNLAKHPMTAVVGLGFCTGSFVSPQGLVVTNHHCAAGTIQYNSTAERNLLESGFLAADFAAELPAEPSLRIYVTRAIDEVTDRVVGDLGPGVTGKARFDAIDSRSKALVAECEKDAGHRCDIYTFHGGLQFFRIKQLEIRDVRLVYAPAGAVGNFGGDVDNWMWPRHTGDFSFLRAYVGPDGKPAPYAKENKPFAPDSFLEVEPKGLQPGDYAMVVGYPGATNRHRLAEELADAIEWRFPLLIDQYGKVIRLVESSTKSAPEAALKYAATIDQFNNALKNYQGQLEGFAKTTAVADKRAAEAQLLAWIAADPKRKAAYAADVAALRDELARLRRFRERDVTLALMLPGNTSTLLTAARELYRLSIERGKPDAGRELGYLPRDEVRIEARLAQLDRRMDPQTDRAVLGHWLTRYAALPKELHVAELDTWLGAAAAGGDAGALAAKLDALYAGTKLTDNAERQKWFKSDRKAIEASDDTFLQAIVAIMPGLLRLEAEAEEAKGRDYRLRPRYLEALVAHQRSLGRVVYPDANNSLRVTVGQVTGYSPKDGVEHVPFTTLPGLVAKHTGEEPFDTPKAELDAYAARRFGTYADAKLGTVPVNFLTNLDITGGNSGSPTLNGEAKLVGVVFDGNWESVSSNWVFNPALTRAIHADIRYMLWIMDEVDGADRLIREMGLTPAN